MRRPGNAGGMGEPQASVVGQVRAGLAGLDALRRWQGRLLDVLGFGPRQRPSRVLLETPALRVRTYPAPGSAPPVLLVAAPIKRAYIWDLAPRASTVGLLADAGFAVHLLEWRDPAPADADRGLDDYADLLLGQAVDAVRDARGRAPVLVGHSLGGTLAAVFAAAHPERLRGLVLLEAPLHFGRDAGAFAPLVAASPDLRPLQPTLGLVPGSLLDLATVVAAPQEFVVERHLDLLTSLGRPQAWLHLRVARWSLDEFALPARLFVDVVETLYRDDALMRGRLAVAGRRVGPATLTAPLLSVVDPLSTAIPPSSILPFHHAAACRDKVLLEYRGDQGVALQHVGVLVGATAHTAIWPQIVEWIDRLP
jgi:polyhydroxyalkanoate synthase subunit PhaC